ncbi:helix-turn-helix transcriptional regulator [Vibrio mediterranei]|uniref:helix-turn-helix transcriptional regulator n=1 Tax=Vibrio mediterranei TaxID=689 RepID=UPI001EFD8862|nr:helix-turn-helix transcriptional regulator [Vibrio mediterranei]MCG9623750.1 helix-turn-helix transcriptional regulator [Vibrio mediterranei]
MDSNELLKTASTRQIIDVQWLRSLDEAAKRYGLDIATYRGGIKDWHEQMERPKVSLDSLEEAIALVEAHPAAFDIVIDAGTSITANHLGVLGAFLYSAPSVDVMLKFFEAFSLVFCPAVKLVFIHRLNEKSELWMLRHDNDKGMPTFSNLGFSYYCIALITFIRSTQKEACTVEFFFERDPLDDDVIESLEQRFNCRIFYGHKIRRITLPSWFVNKPCTYANSELNATLVAPMHYSAESTMDSSLAEQVFAVFKQYEVTDITIDSVSRHFHMSSRTLTRKLSAQSLSFRTLLDRYKLERAISLSANPSTNLTQIALEVGFKDLSSFSRAFKRWTGESPKSLFNSR